MFFFFFFFFAPLFFIFVGNAFDACLHVYGIFFNLTGTLRYVRVGFAFSYERLCNVNEFPVREQGAGELQLQCVLINCCAQTFHFAFLFVPLTLFPRT